MYILNFIFISISVIIQIFKFYFGKEFFKDTKFITDLLLGLVELIKVHQVLK